jgi:hypothetical protein
MKSEKLIQSEKLKSPRHRSSGGGKSRIKFSSMLQVGIIVGVLAAPHTPRHGYPPILLAFIEKTASDEAHFSSVTFPAEATRGGRTIDAEQMVYPLAASHTTWNAFIEGNRSLRSGWQALITTS